MTCTLTKSSNSNSKITPQFSINNKFDLEFIYSNEYIVNALPERFPYSILSK